MSRVLRRLEKLEARLTDRSHFAPHSQEWFDYWLERLDRCFNDGDDQAIVGMPREFYDAMTKLAEKEEAEERAAQSNESDSVLNGLGTTDADR